ncbi:MAG: Methylated-DNA--protein-cysteine methyltransferase [Ktedonobacterales bacterium]|jgi:methylated-DNA-protein-cysteine methyltransferase-like protein|nr:MAG: Methylated-DNA--protein-cysteine methyltransferase [Ktedonobacterales bacterium]
MAEAPMTRDDVAAMGAKVYALVRACPPGKVTTYGWLAAAIGQPKAARVVGWIMNKSPHAGQIPAQRVVNSKGELTGSWAFGQRGRMRALLEHEGITFNEAGRIDMKRFGWNPTTDLTEEGRDSIFSGANMSDLEPDDELMRLILDDPASPFRIKPEE